jgi:hypothetical protein
MQVTMTQTIMESVNGSRTHQAFPKGASYQVPDPVGQRWIARGWAVAAEAPTPEAARPVPPAPKRKE